MIRFLTLSGLLLVFMLGTTAAFRGLAQENSADTSEKLTDIAPLSKQSFGAWAYNCEPVTGAPEPICTLDQTVLAEDYPAVKLEIMFHSVIDSNDMLMRVTAPIGVLLSQGLGLSIDDKSVGVVPFTRCVIIGCFANVQMERALFDKLFKGEKAHFTIAFTPESLMGLPFELKGLAEGMARLGYKAGP